MPDGSPWLVAAGALSCAAVLALALIGASRFVPEEPSHRAAKPADGAFAAAPVAMPGAMLAAPLASTTVPAASALAAPLGTPELTAVPAWALPGTAPDPAAAELT